MPESSCMYSMRDRLRICVFIQRMRLHAHTKGYKVCLCAGAPPLNRRHPLRPCMIDILMLCTIYAKTYIGQTTQQRKQTPNLCVSHYYLRWSGGSFRLEFGVWFFFACIWCICEHIKVRNYTRAKRVWCEQTLQIYIARLCELFRLSSRCNRKSDCFVKMGGVCGNSSKGFLYIFNADVIVIKV